ncbi:Phage tail sheath protein [Streptomyces venezuelae]|uniref:phage tail sheath subtilisin-like domain-containing protein n=1 Tax=Streptomyces gardneri TaxID=66892 RepID=UPI0006BCE99D|nr:phage tail sheath subtilisin-like domain-containing protein [Streptomyces gardneri]ALO13213.1 Phage tail sheath protein [Streptomyces venezuelae]QPK49876.1 phage tail sheath family protein [Streptomyces gardneri]WRK41442.1 phage tail sheath subtilisin-like domain-containing protein [Streptomyces venezuelae]CUM36105.1 Phage tail sheath protein FI [Streptomyces venezuelae]
MPTYLSPGVYVEEVASGSRPIEGVGTSVAAFVGLSPVGPLNEPVLVTNWSQYVAAFGDFTDGYYLAHSVYGFFNNGGTAAYVVRVGGGDALGATQAIGTAAPAEPQLVAGEAVGLGAFRVAAITAGSEAGGALTVEVQDVEGDTERFKLVVKDGEKVVESFDASAKKSARNYVVAQVKQRSKTIVLEEAAGGAQLVRPDAQAVTLAPPAQVPAPVAARTGGSAALESGQFIGDSADRTGFGGLEAYDEINMVAVPDLMAAYQQGLIDLEQIKAVQLGLIAHCELMGDRMAILDPPPGLNARDIRTWRQETAGYDSRYAALYYPWIKSFDPATGQTRTVPPSGHMAGVWARNDSERGVHKAPANEIVRGAVDLELQITRGEQDLLNPIGVNCIRAFPGRGIRVWGARTLASDPAWRYLNVRRYFNYLEESILVGTQWVVFEPNDQSLWARIRRNISAFLVNEWRQGALFGQRAEDAFYVKCDAETNPPESVDLGRVVCEIGIAPVKPAEFVVFRLAQFQGGGGDLEE